MNDQECEIITVTNLNSFLSCQFAANAVQSWDNSAVFSAANLKCCGQVSPEEDQDCNVDVGPNYFLCDDAKHIIPIEEVCDYDYECLDYSDEKKCNSEGKMFACNDGKSRVAHAYVCDGETNCGDASDEQNCGEFKSTNEL